MKNKGKILRIDRPKKYQRIKCLMNIYHPYKIWYNYREENKRHIRKCTSCGKLQERTIKSIRNYYTVYGKWKNIKYLEAPEPMDKYDEQGNWI